MNERLERARRALNRAINRYARREAAYNGASFDTIPAIWLDRQTSAMAYVRQARDLAGRLEAMVYDGVGL